MTSKDNDKPSPSADNDNKKVSAADAAKMAAQAKSNISPQSGPSTESSTKQPSRGQEKTNKKNLSVEANDSVRAATNKASNQSTTSKTAILALLLALSAIGGVGGLYYFQNQQLTQTQQQVSSASQQRIEQLTQTVEQQLATMKKAQQQQVSDVISDVEQRNKNRLAELEAQISQLLERQPQNWQITEAEYLARMAGRVLWLEKDTATAISLLKDANARLVELKDPRLYSIRELLHKDIESLATLPALDRGDLILALMALSEQVDQLPLSSAQVPQSIETTTSNALSEDVSDWRENLAKSWRKFKREFITISYRQGNVEPLLAADQSQNLIQNMQLKFQLAQWAAAKGETELYQQTMQSISQWLSDYFDMTEAKTQRFNARLIELSVKPVTVDYPQQLQSQQALRKLLDGNGLKQTPAAKEKQAESLPSASSEGDS
ncbi:uroporphyrinogen-III C-methyltransferase [Thalassotalea ponticola]|uniref:uroporphyrinogen-III C-methyltransferase n=1 Tax=Thalassotalea ponticola TaxID=1523392 RepID=UPI0025B47AF3|nr:uroporphyrinogen-III C-methyltransferase [Thalassotalea ponticola]MDN3652773.1 uroporphyrinogen-III C-methyltransferase [Thalassotalea ponticola]